MARYLYGNSSPSPLDYDFLEHLEKTVECAVRVLSTHGAVSQMRREADDKATIRRKSRNAVEQVHKSIGAVLKDEIDKQSDASARKFAETLLSQAKKLVDDVRVRTDQRNEADLSAVREEVRKCHSQMHGALEAYLTNVRLDVVSWSATLNVKGTAPEMTATYLLPDEITATFQLDPASQAPWTAPRRVSDFCHDVVIQIGLKKGWLRRAPQPEMAQLDDHVVSRFELDETTGTIVLRKKPDGPDVLQLDLRVAKEGLVAYVTRMADGTGATPFSIKDTKEQAALERLRGLMRIALQDKPLVKSKLLSLELKGKDTLEAGSERELIQRLLGQLSSTVRAVDENSPNPEELSLKREDDDGKREELYLPKKRLLERIRTLPADLQQDFVSIGLVERRAAPPPTISDEPTADFDGSANTMKLTDLTEPEV